MRRHPYPLRPALIPLFFLCPFLSVLSCAYKGEANFPVSGTGGVLYGTSKAASSGILHAGANGVWAKREKLEYRFEPPLAVPPLCSLELEYGFSANEGGERNPAEHIRDEFKENYQLVLRVSGDAWVLPWDASFIGPFAGAAGEGPAASPAFHYAVPLPGGIIENFSIEMIPVSSDAKKPPRLDWELRGLRLVAQWYGLVREESGGFYATPFVYCLPEGGLGLDIPSRFRMAEGADLSAASGAHLSGGIAAELGGRRFEARAGLSELVIRRGNLPAESYPVKVELPGIGESDGGAGGIDGGVTGGGSVAAAPAFAVTLRPSEMPEFPSPIPADPGLILAYPQENWRNRGYEVFRWESFPSLLVFDTADYAVQDRLLKRLAFFTEKAGYRGRLATDAEIADQHGWNAHDYRSEDLARFFGLARSVDFPLLPEERELERILLDAGIIRSSGGGMASGEGGIISISRESPDYLRTLFMVHEGFHGLFFIDADFRDYSRRRWGQFDPAVKRFILSYFDYQHYDIKDEYLVINEFMAHCLQQSASQAPRYFGETLASRIDDSPWRRTVLPKKDEASGSWPAIASAFRLEAAAFSDYVNRRWGLSAGRVRQITVRGE
jgi:hypothetical protein